MSQSGEEAEGTAEVAAEGSAPEEARSRGIRDHDPSRVLYVANVGYETTDADVIAFFERFGTVVGCEQVGKREKGGRMP